MRSIYTITNVVTRDFYVGSTVDHVARWKTHRNKLRYGTHHCPHLQASWNKHGAAAFVFVAVEDHENSTDAELAIAEQRWLDEHVGKPYCYNASRTVEAPWRGVTGVDHPLYGGTRSDATKQKLSEAARRQHAEHGSPRLGRTHSDESKAKMSAAKVGKNAGENHYRWGKKLSEEVRKKIGDTQRGKSKGIGRRISPEGRASITAAATAGRYSHWEGKRHSEESRAAMRRRVAATPPGGVETVYGGVQEAAEAAGVNYQSISRVIRGGGVVQRGKAKGWKFRYPDQS